MTNIYEPPIFVVGLPRPGSTLLELAVSKSPGVLRLAEGLYLSLGGEIFAIFYEPESVIFPGTRIYER